MMMRKIAIWLLPAAAWLLWSAALAAPSEELHYVASYRGVFSAGAEVRIADLVFRTRSPAEDAPYLETELAVSSQAYSAVESFYPIRYRFRSWYWRDRSGVLASEYHEFGDPADTDHKLIYLDRPGRPFISRRLRRDRLLDIPALEAGTYRPAAARGQRRAFDRLGLLQHIRSRERLRPGRVYDAVVSNGSRMLHYRVKVEKRTTLTVAGKTWSALKLRFDGFQSDERGREEHSHRPVYLWVSADRRHIPLRAEARHALGRFRIELSAPPRAATRVAVREE